jgi:hypothetical protein
MISDTLAEAVVEIREYMRRMLDTYKDNAGQLNQVCDSMLSLSILLDGGIACKMRNIPLNEEQQEEVTRSMNVIRDQIAKRKGSETWTK